jgi:hypothetical protein
MQEFTTFCPIAGYITDSGNRHQQKAQQTGRGLEKYSRLAAASILPSR